MLVDSRHIGRALIVVAVVVMMAVGLGVSPFGSGPTRASAGDHIGRRSALSAAVPTSRYVVLGEGRRSRVRWAIILYRRPNASQPIPCLEEVDLVVGVGVLHGSSCGPPAPPSRWPTLTAAELEGGTAKAKAGVFVVGMLFGPAVHQAVIDFGPGPTVERATNRLSRRQA